MNSLLLSNQKFSKTNESYRGHQVLSRTTSIFKDYQRLEFVAFKFKYFQGPGYSSSSNWKKKEHMHCFILVKANVLNRNYNWGSSGQNYNLLYKTQRWQQNLTLWYGKTNNWSHTICTKRNSSSLANNKIASCNVPGMDTKLPESIGPSTGDSTHVDCSTALWAYSAHTTIKLFKIYTNTHVKTALFSGTIRVSWKQKGKP